MFYELAEKVYELEKQGKRIIKLNIGDTNLPTPECAVNTAIDYLKSKKARYVSSAGIPELRERIAEKEGCEVGNVVVGPGSKHLIYALMSVVEGNGEIVFPSPNWPAYALAAKQLGIRMNIIGTKMENGWHFDGLPLEKAKMAIICNPLNPTSTVYPEELIRRTIEEGNENGVIIILDEAYKDLAFKQIPKYGGAIRVRSFSKEFNMEGWRLGYAIAPKDIAEKLVKYNQITTTCVPEFTQRAGIACLENEQRILQENRRIWKERVEAAKNALSAAGFSFVVPDAGIYIFATKQGITDSGKYALSLLDKGVGVAPGSEFGGYNNFVRLCLNQPKEILEEAIEKMASD